MKKQGLTPASGGAAAASATTTATGSSPATVPTTPEVKTEGVNATSATSTTQATDGDTAMQEANGSATNADGDDKSAITPAHDVKIENIDTNMASQASPTEQSPPLQTPQGSPQGPASSPLVNMSPAGQQSPVSSTPNSQGQTPVTTASQDGVKPGVSPATSQATTAAANAVAAAAAAANGNKPSTTPPISQNTTPRHPWELVDEIMSMLKTGYPVLALSMETMVDQIQLKLKPQADEDMYRLIVALLNDGIQVQYNELNTSQQYMNALHQHVSDLLSFSNCLHVCLIPTILDNYHPQLRQIFLDLLKTCILDK
jgi:transformation/transcription domain-associated protein